MKQAFRLIIVFVALSCSKDSFIDTESPSVDGNNDIINERIEHNVWTYNQMLENYFWYDEMPDSNSLDFTQEPSAFFEHLKSKRDRFSWCEINQNYKSTRGVNLSETVSLDTVYIVNGLKIGYVVYKQFEESTDVVQIMLKMKQSNIKEFILDLRDNPGGYVSTSSYLASFLAPQKYLGKLYLQQRYNDKIEKLYKQIYGGNGIDSVYLNNNKITQTYNLNLNRLFVLTSLYSASSSEALIIGLRPYMDVITIGKTTYGKDVGSFTISNNKYKFQLQPITFRYYNAKRDSTPINGIKPTIAVEEESHYPKGDINDPCIQEVLRYISNKDN